MKKLLSFGPLFIIIAALLWSLDGLLRRSLYTLPPAIIVFYEHFLGAIILLPFTVKFLPDLKKMGKKEWQAIILVALFSGALGTIFYTKALGMVNYIQFSVVVLLQQLQPVWAILAASILLKEKISKDFVKWAALAILAAYFVTFRDLKLNYVSSSGTIIAAILAILAGVVWAVSTSYSKIVLFKTSFITATFLRFVLAPIFALIIIFAQKQQNMLFALSLSQVLTLLTITFSTGMVALVIYYYGLRNTPARVSTICELVWPGSAIIIDCFIFKQALSITQIIGIIVLITAIYHVTKYKK